METAKFDKVFRDKTDAFEMKPSSQAWEQIAQQLPSNRRFVASWPKVAAIGLLTLGMGWMAHRYLSATHEPVTAHVMVDYPRPEVPIDWAIPVKKPSTASTQMVTGLQYAKTPVATRSETRVPVYEELALTRREWDSSWLITPHEPASAAMPKMSSPAGLVKINYYAGATEPGPGASKKKVTRLLVRAQQTSPAELWADLRQAKDDLISHALKLD
ncbi:MAG: hypothetical protein OEY56_08120 [Cyclobacteriaceae bacterium]|nr:hypothetical protein [Cyclobacteriaceae bacterium]